MTKIRPYHANRHPNNPRNVKTFFKRSENHLNIVTRYIFLSEQYLWPFQTSGEWRMKGGVFQMMTI